MNFLKVWVNAQKYCFDGLKVGGRQEKLLHRTILCRKPSQLSLAGCAPAEPTFASPATFILLNNRYRVKRNNRLPLDFSLISLSTKSGKSLQLSQRHPQETLFISRNEYYSVNWPMVDRCLDFFFPGGAGGCFWLSD